MEGVGRAGCLSEVGRLYFGAVLPFKPSAEAVKPGEEYPFGHVCLVEFVADLPFKRCRDDDLAPYIRIFFQPAAQDICRAGHNRKERELVHYSVVNRRRLEKNYKVIFAEFG